MQNQFILIRSDSDEIKRTGSSKTVLIGDEVKVKSKLDSIRYNSKMSSEFTGCVILNNTENTFEYKDAQGVTVKYRMIKRFRKV